MTRLPSQVITAPSGVDLTSDPVAMPINRARLLVNFQIDRAGQVSGKSRLVDQLPNGERSPIDGVAWYYQAAVRNNQTGIILHTDLLVWVTGGFLLIGTPSSDPFTIPIGNRSVVFGGFTGYTGFSQFFPGKRVRFAALADELLMVQDGGILPLRFYYTDARGGGLYRAGIEPPNITGVNPVASLSLAATGTGLTGTWSYKLTFSDERFRESSPTPAVSITLANQGARAKYDTTYQTGVLPKYGGSNLVYANLYRNTIGAPSVYYKIAQATVPQFPVNPVTFASGDYLYNPSAQAYDFAPDSSIVAGILAPNPGENDPPNAASIIAIHKNRVFLNDVTDNTVLQVSNLLSTTQYTLVPASPAIATDGVRSSIGTDQGDPITALVPFGSVLAIFKRRGCFFLYGDSLSDFVIRPVHDRGCIAPDTCVRCNNIVCFLSDDGVYAASYDAGDVVTKISKEIEQYLFSATQAQREAAVAFFVDNRYYLIVNNTTFFYDFDAEGWSTLAFGRGTLYLGDGVPDVSIFPGFGFNALPNAGLYGSVVPDEGCSEDCSITVSPTSAGVLAEGGSVTVIITALNEALYGHAISDAWIHYSGPGKGSGTATITIDPNASCPDRSGYVTICDQTILIDQEGSDNCCDVVATPSSFDSLPNGPSTQTIIITLLNSVLPTASSDVAWLHVSNYNMTSATTGYFTVDVDAVDFCTDRIGHVLICDESVLFHQPFSEVFVPPSVVATGDAQYVSTTLHGENWVGDTFTLTPANLGGYISHYPDLSDPTLTVFIPQNLFGQTGDGKGGGETVIWLVNGCSGVLTITQYPDCIGSAWAATEPQTAVSVDGQPVEFLHTYSIFVPNQFDANFPAFSSGVWTAPLFSNQPPHAGSPAAAYWTLTTPNENTVTFTPDSPNFNMTPAQLAEFNDFIHSHGDADWNVTLFVHGLTMYLPFFAQVSVGFTVSC
jgi:hypothetical protein